MEINLQISKDQKSFLKKFFQKIIQHTQYQTTEVIVALNETGNQQTMTKYIQYKNKYHSLSSTGQDSS